MHAVKPKDELKLQAIAVATYALVHQRGLSALTLADIARKAGLATSTLYVYFASREVLLDALYERAKTLTFAKIMNGDASSVPVKARIRRIWLNLLDVRLQYPEQIFFLEQYASSGQLSEHNRALSARLVLAFHAILEQGQRDEVLKTVPLALLVGAIVGSVQEAAKLMAGQVLPDDDATRASAFLMCWDAMKA